MLSISIYRLLLLLLAVPLFLSFSACAAPKPKTDLDDRHLRPCPDSPNCVNSEAVAGPARIAPLAFSGNPELAWQNLRAAIKETGGRVADYTPTYLRAEYTSAVFRFKDDVEFRLNQQSSCFEVRSASRSGYWDLGVNRRRVEKIRRIFADLGK